MTCPRCQAETPSDAEFCPECGTKLAAVCPQCGTANAPGHKFCKKCGHSLVQVGAVGPGAAPKFASADSYTPKYLAEKILTSKNALEGERKQVTVLFADLKGSMELLADRDPEEARKLLDPVLERMMEAVHRYEGTVNQVMGDGIMALFGAPLAHEDHAVRACYAALRMQEAVKQYAEEVHRTEGIPIQIRVGLNSGEVVVRSIGSDLHMDYTAVGQTTHLASRVEQMAMPGSVLMPAETLRLAEDYVQVKALGPRPVKGLEAPVEVYEIVGASTVRSRLKAAAARGLTRFVGRDSELDQLRQALERARTGHGQVVAVIGEPGVGKSRLYWEFTHSHQIQGWLIVESASVSYGKASAYLPVIDLLKAYFQIEDRDDARKIREKVSGKLVTLEETLIPTLSAFLALLDVPVDDSQWQALDPPQRRQRTLDAVKRLVLRESQVQPLCLVFEDLHWTDSETQAVLDTLVDSLPSARLLLLVNYRPEYQHGWGSKTYYTQLRIDPLPPESAEELLQGLVGKDAELQAFRQLLIERTEGNPFFLEESVRALVETKDLVGERGAYRLAKPIQTIQVPATVQAVVAARIDRLPPEDKRLLQSASVIGEDVPFTLLQAIVEMPEEELRRALSRLQTVEFLYETSLFPDLEYTFKHALTYQVAYNSLLQERKKMLDAKVVEAIERLHGDRLAEQTEALARHALRGEVWDKALIYLRQAGHRAIQRSANVEAISHLTKGLEVLKALAATPERDHQELALQTTLGPALIATKGYGAPEVEQAYARARELCQQVGEPPQLFLVLRGLWNVYLLRAQLQMAHELGEQLLSLAQGGQDPALLVGAYRALGTTLFFQGEFAPAQEHAEQGMTVYDPQQHRSLAFLYGADPGMVCRLYATLALWHRGYADQALKRMAEALTLAQQLSHPHSLAFALNYAAVLRQFRREGQPAQEQAEAAMTLSAEQRFAQWLAWGTVMRGWALAAQGEGEEGIAQIRQGLAAWRVTGAELSRPYFLALLAEAYGSVGQVEEGLNALTEALGLVDKNGERWWEAEIHRLKGELLLQHAVPDEPQAEACFHQALDVARRQQAKSLELRAAMSLSRLWQGQGRNNEARQLLAAVYDWFTEGFDTADLKEAKALLEELS